MKYKLWLLVYVGWLALGMGFDVGETLPAVLVPWYMPFYFAAVLLFPAWLGYKIGQER